MKKIKLFEQFNNNDAYLIIIKNNENESEKIGFGNMKGYIVIGDEETAYNKASELTNGPGVVVDMDEPSESLGTTSVIKLVNDPSLKEGEISGSDLYDLVAEGTEDPNDTIYSLLNTLG